ncbi:MFS transporter [Segetibacter koreensis]|uniref:MFS transporter n=1 Tax=Segetibacter koreensis TaxID=398037 RepID=UPI00036617BC|nr:MFS transporter [Segetibacter koreensis]
MHTNEKKSLSAIIAASSLGTLIEWYDFYIFGSLATIISTKFFPSGNPTAALLSTLATFAAGFVVRPFGALFFGRLGDLIGRKHTFLVTLVIMGLSTFLIGCVPSYNSIGFLAPVLVLLLRLLQGLALGGEYGGAATYVAEHSPVHQRGFYTSWIQTTATLGLFISLFVIIITKGSMNENSFNRWGWRVPFWISILMVIISVMIRMKMRESPVFAKAKSEGKTSKNPLKESFGHKLNFKFVLLALFGATMGQGVVWYTGQFYALSFIQNTLNIDITQGSKIIMLGLGFGTPFFLVFGALSDRIGRKWIMLAGMLVAVFSYRPIYSSMYDAGSLKNKQEIPAKMKIETSEALTGESIQRTTVTTKEYEDGTVFKESQKETIQAGGVKINPPMDVKMTKAVILDNSSFWKLVGLVFVQVIFVTMVYGPIAAFLVEMFPVKIRYTSMSLPYHIGNGIFGGLLPAIATFLAAKATQANEAATKAGTALPYDKPFLEGLWYPIIIAAVCFIIGALYINAKDKNAFD